MHPTPHGLRLVAATPLGTPTVSPHARPAARAAGWQAQLQVRTWVMAALALPLCLGVAASAADAHAENARLEALDVALVEASRFAEVVAVPLRAAASPPSAERVRELQQRMARVAPLAGTQETTTRVSLPAPRGVEIVTRAAVAPGGGTAVCLAAVRWPAPASPGQAVRPSWKGPHCFVEGGAAAR